MPNVWELQVVPEENGKYPFQDCQIVVTDTLAEARGEGKCKFQDCSVLGQGAIPFRASFMFFTDSGMTGFPKDKLNNPIDVQCQVKPDASQYAINGKKYLFKLKSVGKSGFGGKGGGGWSRPAETPEDKFRKQLVMLTAYAKDYAKDHPEMKKEDLVPMAILMDDQIESYLALKVKGLTDQPPI